MARNVPNPPAGKKINKHIGALETAGWGAYYVASTGLSVAQTATSTSTLAVCSAAAAGAAVSATGVGLVIAAGALTIGSTAVNARAAHKSRIHRKHLREIEANYSSYDCYGFQQVGVMTEHFEIAQRILPYIVKQKGKKYGRRVRYAIPGVNLFSTLRAVGTNGWKRFKGKLGKERLDAAEWLIGHLFTHDCELVEAIIAELFSEKEMLWVKYHCEADVAIPLIAHKLRST